MAEPLKNHFGAAIPRKIAGMISEVYPAFDAAVFLDHALSGYDELNLMQRGRKISESLHRYLPEDYREAINILLASLDSTQARATGSSGMASFLYLPHTYFVADFGLDHFEESMRALYVLTQRFTGEFSIRPFLERYPKQTLARLKQWTKDPNLHVRRLVSEGTRPRLPWASRLRAFQADPRPVLALLELLKDDPELYVRRSVANNLNDIGKDHPDLLAETARTWLADATPDRRWIVRHALRSAVKRGEPEALKILGFGKKAAVVIGNPRIHPESAGIGTSVLIAFDLANNGRLTQRVLVDFRVHFVKSNGGTSSKVFKLKNVDLPSGASIRFQKKLSLAQMTTRKHYPGRHQVDVILNGRALRLGEFTIVAASTFS